MDELLIRALSLLGLAILVALAARRLRLPYTVGLVLAGAALVGFRVDAGLALTHDLIFDVVLPPLLFEAALNLGWRELRRDLVPVLTLATVGVVLCAGVVAGGSPTGSPGRSKSALAFGALIAATDPISVIALLRGSGVTGRLRLLIEAESLFNDGAAAVLFALVLVWFAHAGSIGWLEAATIFAQTSPAADSASAPSSASRPCLSPEPPTIISSRRRCPFSQPSARSSIAEHFHASGVLATVAAGIVMGNLGVLGRRRASGWR